MASETPAASNLAPPNRYLLSAMFSPTNHTTINSLRKDLLAIIASDPSIYDMDSADFQRRFLPSFDKLDTKFLYEPAPFASAGGYRLAIGAVLPNEYREMIDICGGNAGADHGGDWNKALALGRLQLLLRGEVTHDDALRFVPSSTALFANIPDVVAYADRLQREVSTTQAEFLQRVLIWTMTMVLQSGFDLVVLCKEEALIEWFAKQLKAKGKKEIWCTGKKVLLWILAPFIGLGVRFALGKGDAAWDADIRDIKGYMRDFLIELVSFTAYKAYICKVEQPGLGKGTRGAEMYASCFRSRPATLFPDMEFDTWALDGDLL